MAAGPDAAGEANAPAVRPVPDQADRIQRGSPQAWTSFQLEPAVAYEGRGDGGQRRLTTWDSESSARTPKPPDGSKTARSRYLAYSTLLGHAAIDRDLYVPRS